MAGLTDTLAKQLDDVLFDDFADIYLVEALLVGKIERKHDLDDPDVIAALGTCADVRSVAQRLVARPPAALVAGLTATLARKGVRPSAALLVRALLEGARRAASAPPAAASKLPLLAQPERLPPLVQPGARKPAARDEVLAVVEQLRAATLATEREAFDPLRERYTEASLAALGRALALGWLALGADPKHRWMLAGAAQFPDDATAKDLATLAAALAPRVGQSPKARDLVDVLAGMNTRAGLEGLDHLATTVRSKAVRDKARAAFAAAATALGSTTESLADQLLPARPSKKQLRDVVRRLEQRMIDGTRTTALALIEHIVQHPAASAAADGVLFATVAAPVRIFALEDAHLVDERGAPFVPNAEEEIVVVHPLDLTAKQLAAWRARGRTAPFPQLDREAPVFASSKALAVALGAIAGGVVSPRKLFALEARGWARGEVHGGAFDELVRTLRGATCTLAFTPGVQLNRGMAAPQTIRRVHITGGKSKQAVAEMLRDLGSLA